METLLRVRGLERRYGGKPVLAGVDFALASGEVLGLLGPNGAGKSTCLRILAGLLAPSAGRVTVGGDDLARHPERAKRRIGYLPERPPLYPEMRVAEYLDHCARLRRIPPGAIARAVARVERLCGLTEVRRRLLGKLSKGYQQRAGLAAALLHEPELVILDEPTDGLDPVQMREVRGLIAELGNSAAVIISSHALTEVQATCRRVIVLHQGRMLHDGRLDTPRALLLRVARPPKLAALKALAPVAAAVPVARPVPGSSIAEPGTYRIELTDGACAEQLAAAVVAAGWGLVELGVERTDVERLFFQTLGMEAA
ncbi:ABC transporter ATP-binding protein [Thiohalocapsa sp. ML1]|uniref:ABC transporter ATP-binding protein n=1 Tax=Thiohalocapsa sp. ML1 TaxID=1431688 RepID=UPI0007320DED|nr:ABC transporter ATP-binding protein [Thiohalocapsa sp. ML1]